MGVLPTVTQAVVIGAQQPRLDAVERGVEVVAAAEQLCGGAAIFSALFNKAARLKDRHHQHTCGVLVLIDKGLGTAEYFFWVVRPDRLGGRQGKTLMLLHCAGAPGLADAKAIDASGLQVRDHLRWRHYHAVHIL